MTLQQIYYLLTIEESHSMNKAAEKLFIAQPTLTSAVKEAEQEVGIPIFLRTHKGVIPTAEGAEFLAHLRGLYQQYEVIMQQYGKNATFRRKFSVSMQHYSFAVQAFIEMAKRFDTSQFDLRIRETKTLNVIHDVGTLKSEIGILYISSLNQKVIQKLLHEQELIFHPLIRCQACVYLSKSHPLAKEKEINFHELEEYPCLSFEQNNDTEIYFAEEVLNEETYAKTIKATDRATMMNLMDGLNGYTLCSSIFSEKLSEDKFVVIPFRMDDGESYDKIMEIGYIIKKNVSLSSMGQQYIEELVRSLKEVPSVMTEKT